ncbi:hypothetical protein DEO45_10050 [Rhodanobacter denitrificans]|uniref:Uncharacterized protein n=1 Tax=Rhodanobacter denitrificans TaxID=666685 RepID=A0A368KEA7_9GAMM|nr:hypothetical protein [Rhodanobacter denitrificans]RCS29508.1 hypothetical protein DEO45_10050 [Rhodanobacter denitrificans]
MTRPMRNTALLSAALAALLLSACGKNEPVAPPASAPAPAHTAAVPAPAPAPAATAAQPAAATTTHTSDVAPSAPATPPPAPLTVAKLTLGSAVNAEYKVTRPGNRFATSDRTIYASVATEGSTGGATLNAKWSYLEGQGQLVSSISQSIATDGPAITTFKVQNPDLWPEGKYRVEISLDGKSVAKQDFEIRKS